MLNFLGCSAQGLAVASGVTTLAVAVIVALSGLAPWRRAPRRTAARVPRTASHSLPAGGGM